MSLRTSLYSFFYSFTFTPALVRYLGRLHAWAFGREKPSRLLFFFSTHNLGGAERVHVRIVAAVADQHPWVFFSDRSKPDSILSEFIRSARVFELSSRLKRKWSYDFQLGRISTLINRTPNAVVFGSYSRFFYDLLPLLSPRVRRLDLTHNFDGETEFRLLASVPLLDTRVAITRHAANHLAQLYREAGIPASYAERISVIGNCVDVPQSCGVKTCDGCLNVLFIGRGAKEKRLHLIGRIARRCAQEKLSTTFTLVGPGVEDQVEQDCRAFCDFPGAVQEPAALAQMYDRAHVILLTSAFEGFPLVCMEGMAHGVIPVATDVGAIREHVTPGETGFLVPAGADEERIVNDVVLLLSELAARPDWRRSLPGNVRAYAAAHFDTARFQTAYRQLLLGH